MRRFILSIAVLLSCTAYAQTDTLRAVVNVHNEYNPVHIKVNKKSFVPTTTASETRKSSPSYEFTREAMPFGGFVSERSTKELLKGEEKPYYGYARAGYGTDNGLDLKAAYRRDITARDNINAVASVDGYKSELDGVFNEWESRMYRSMASLGLLQPCVPLPECRLHAEHDRQAEQHELRSPRRRRIKACRRLRI